MPDLLGRPAPGDTRGPVDLLGRPLAEPLSSIAPALDFLARGQYASAGFFDALINDQAGVDDALSQAWSELVSPTQRKSFSDVIRRSNPQFATANPMATKVLGFLGDIALDPTTYLGLGFGAATKGARIGGRALTTLGETYRTALQAGLAGREAAFGISQLGRAGEIVARETLTRLPREIAEGARIAEAGSGLFRGSTVAEVAGDAARSLREGIKAAIGGKLPKGITDQALDDLARAVSLERLGIPEVADKALTVVRRNLDYGEVVESADQVISKLAAISPDIEKAIFKPMAKLSLNVGIPFTKAEARLPLITAEGLRAVGLDRLDGLVKAVTALPGIKQAVNAGKVVRGAFDRFYDLPESYIKTITNLQNEYDFVKYDVVRDVKALADDVTAQGRDRISKVMNAFEAGVGELPEEQARALAPDIFRMALRQTPLQPAEQAITLSLIQGYARASELERALGVTAQFAANLDPRVYGAIAESAEDTADFLRRLGPGATADVAGLNAAKLDKIKDLMAAAAEGSDIGQDAMLLYASRVISARQRLPREQMKGALKAIFGTDDVGAIAKLPGGKRIANDLRYYGEYKFPTGADEGTSILGAADWLIRKWKGIKTVYSPSFAPRQAVSNSIQSALALGNEAYRAFDPRAYAAAAKLVLGRAAERRPGLPEQAAEFLSRFTDAGELPAAQQLAERNLNQASKAANLASGFELTLPTGKKLTGEELELIARQNGWIRGSTGYSGEFLKRTLREEIGGGRAESFTGKAWEATKALADGYLGLAGHVEDINRLALGINGLLMGYSPRQATQTINRALFDYGRSFSKFEQEVMKRLIPFYSFQRLAVPFVLKESLENPAAPATLNKVAELAGTLITPDEQGRPATLSPAQREIFGRSFLVDQPRIYRGFDAAGRGVFNVFSNLTPFDVLSMFTVTKKNGEMDFRRTAEKSVLGLMTPFLKMPAEVIANRDFFSDRVIADAKGYGGAGKLGKIKDTALDQVLPEPIKALIGWEWGRDRRTGESIAYVNPYFAYTMSQLAPNAARLFVKPLGDGEHILDRSMRLLTGVSEQAIDFKESLEIQNNEDRKTINDARSSIFAARRAGRTDSLTEALADYRRVLQAVAERRARLAQGPISIGETE